MPTNPLKRYAHGTENWALVTGATGGMGEEWAHQLAGLGFNVIVHGRNASKLATLKGTIESKNPAIKVKTATADAGACPPNLDQLRDILDSKSDLKLTVVVNNVGVVSQSYPLLEEVPEAELLSQISTNALFPTLVAQKALPLLKRNQPSLMVNVTSLGAWAPTPYLTPYSGAKSYNLKFSHSLYNEMACEGTQVDVVAMAPGQVVSGMNEGPPSAMMPLSAVWVKKAIGSLAPGLFSARPPPVIIPWGPHAWGNRIMGWMGRSLADSTVRNVTMDMRKKKMATGSPKKTEKAVDNPLQESSSERNLDAAASSTGTGTAIEDAFDNKS
ncbi:hypothetical protein CBS101457_003715 [Exobasidium rhododendri]|nr:hypothetical protein CBS101457_003715 [Exobasidium rhododendri]